MIKAKDKITELVVTVRASMTDEDIISMMREGVVCFRLNCARIPKDQILGKTGLIRRAAQQVGVSAKLFMDLPGPKARIWVLGQRLQIIPGDQIRIHLSPHPVDNGTIQIVGPEFFSAIEKGSVLVIRRRGYVRLFVEERSENWLKTRALSGGYIGEGYHIIIEDRYVPSLGLSQADREVIPIVLEAKPDFLCPSFVDVPQIVTEVREIAQTAGISPMLLAKIESPLALQNLGRILDVSDGAIVGRDDLGAWLDKHSLREETLHVIRQCKAHGLLAVPASNYFKSLCDNNKLSAEERRDLKNVLSLEPDYLYCNETSISERWHDILMTAKSFGMVHEFLQSRKQR